MASFARAFIVCSADSRAAVFHKNVFTRPWEREGGEEGCCVPRADQVEVAASVAEAVRDDMAQKYKYGDDVSEGVVYVGTDDPTGAVHDSPEEEPLAAVYKQLKGTCFVLAVPSSVNLLLASNVLTTLIKLLQFAYGSRPLDFEPRNLLLKPECAHAVVSKALPDGLLAVVDLPLLKQVVKKAVEGMK